MLHEQITGGIIKCFYQVYNTLGYGFLEKVYQNALFLELRDRGFKVEARQMIKVYYRGLPVGEYFADLMVNDTIILELKAVECIVEEHERQLIIYLKGTRAEVGLLLNFGRKPEFRRKVFEINKKH